ncbi:MAG: hypothetical protein M3169_12105 [Candidatus Eremiobacteraeota bacterium]|nr:hypothetical protein [Candidatus Eremiobacteraeota bacterium]
MEVVELRRFAGTEVRVRLVDGTAWRGRLRTELLTENSLAVFLHDENGGGTTLYIDEIAEIERGPFAE